MLIYTKKFSKFYIRFDNLPAFEDQEIRKIIKKG